MRSLPFLAGPVLAVLSASALGCAADATAPSEERFGAVASAATTDIVEVTGFGSNPGALKMYEHVPASLAANHATVVVMHGCTQGAADAAKTGWGDLADQLGFVVVYPEQQTANNSVRCFNWGGEYGDMTNLQRGKGENQSIKEMVDKALAAHGGDPKKVFVVGFSAGGAESVLVAAVWPDVFAGAASIAGIPYGCPASYSDVFSCQSPGKSLSADEWAKRVKAANPGFSGAWPRMTVWQGDADTTVGTANRGEIVKQWAGLHGLDAASPTTKDTVDGQAHSAWKDSGGVVQLETYVIAGMPHGVPIKANAQCGSAGQYTLDKGICAAQHIAEFFGIASAPPPSGSSSSGGDGGASSSGSSGKSASSSSGGSSTSTGGLPGSTGNGASPSDGENGYGRAQSTCATSAAGASGASSLAALGLVALGLTLGRRARRRA